MFAIFFSDTMDPFYQNTGSFPTVIFSFFLLLAVFYWLVAVLGFIEIDALDIDGDINSDSGSPNALAGLAHKFGLNGVPVTVVLTLIALIGWFLSYYAVHFTFPLVPDGILQYLLGLVVLIMAFFASVYLTAFIIRPMRPFFKEDERNHQKNIIGQVAIVRSSRVDASFGEAILDDGGAGLLLKVRALEGEKFTYKDRVVLLEYIAAQHAYTVISEAEFLKV